MCLLSAFEIVRVQWWCGGVGALLLGLPVDFFQRVLACFAAVLGSFWPLLLLPPLPLQPSSTQGAGCALSVEDAGVLFRFTFNGCAFRSGSGQAQVRPPAAAIAGLLQELLRRGAARRAGDGEPCL